MLACSSVNLRHSTVVGDDVGELEILSDASHDVYYKEWQPESPSEWSDAGTEDSMDELTCFSSEAKAVPALTNQNAATHCVTNHIAVAC